MRGKDFDGVGCIKAKTLFFPDGKWGKTKSQRIEKIDKKQKFAA